MNKRLYTGEAFWRTIAAALIGMVATGASAWMVFDQGTVNREEVARMIAEQSPYSADRQIVRETLTANSRLLGKVASDVNEIKVEQAKLIERVENIVTRERTK